MPKVDVRLPVSRPYFESGRRFFGYLRTGQPARRFYEARVEFIRERDSA